jgi:hypothetical protein
MRLAIQACLLLVASGANLTAQQNGPEEFPIFFWHGPPPAFNTLEHWQRVKECNFTVGGPTYYSPDDNRKLLAFCRQLGLRAIVSDPQLNREMLGRQDWRDVVGRIVSSYASEPALYGYYLIDEPNSELFPDLALLHAEVQRRDPKHPPFINLFPTYASTAQLGAPTYSDYIERFMTTVTPAILGYDHYALMKGGGIRADYFENLEIIREHGLRFNVPAWNTVLSIPHYGYRDPSEGDMRWQAYTSLAYGIKGIGWFTYWTIHEFEKEGVAIVGSDGKPARLFPIVRDINSEVRMLGRTLLQLTSTGVFHTGGVPVGCRRLGSDALVQVPPEAPLVLGFFRDPDGGELVMVVNRDYTKPVEYTVSFRPHVVSVAEVSATDGTLEPLALSNRRARLKLRPGDGRLLRLTTSRPLTAIAFQFNTDGDVEGWGHPHGLSEPSVKEGVLAMTFSGSDPFISRGNLRLAPGTVTKIRVRMKLPPCNPAAQLFWSTTDEPNLADDKHLDFPVQPDGAWHEYEIPVGTHPKWRGKTVTLIRFDPTTGGASPGSKVEIDYLRGE